MGKLSVWANECDWVVAESAEEAALIDDNDSEPDDFERLDDSKLLTVHWEHGEQPDDATEDEIEAGERVMTCAEWIASNGRGVLASTEY